MTMFNVILPLSGTPEVKLLDSSIKLRNLILSESNYFDAGSNTIGDNWKVECALMDWCCYIFKSEVSFNIHIHTGLVTSITFMNTYKGKVWEKIGIGSTFKEVLKTKPGCVIEDEGLLCYEEGIWFETDDSISIRDESIVSQITLFSPDFEHLTYQTSNFPETWLELIKKSISTI